MPQAYLVCPIKPNPATLSTELEALFPVSARVAALRGSGDVDLLLPAEAAHLGRSVPKRAQEFAAGRLCARRVFREFGIADFALEVGEDRQPVWPANLVGSITHTADFCAAVVAAKRSVKAIGIDAEAAASVTEKLWPRLFLGPEIEWLHSLTMTQRLSAAALLFSAKEAFYKCQYPLVRQSLGFHDVSVRLPEWGAAVFSGTFLIEPQRKIELLEHTSSPMRGRYLFLGSIVATGIAIMEQASL
jgi:4'-phosphopantetheinyl transferase EntD